MPESTKGSCPYHKGIQSDSTTTDAPATGESLAPPAGAAKCPFSHGVPSSDSHVKSENSAVSTEKKCPYIPPDKSTQHHDVSLDDLQEGDAMCSHARKKLEARKRQAEGVEDGQLAGYLPQQDWNKASSADFKEHFAMAYNEVAVKTASRKPSARIAAILMNKLGYSEQELSIIGEDAWLMQGTGNPHSLANIQPGETVVDLGSGFGMDAFLASEKVGSSGRVVGIDLALGEVSSAVKRAHDRKLCNVDFRLGDIEAPPFPDAFADVVLSNGGFCLVPDKDVAFQQVHRILKPGGRMAISCTTVKCTLDPSLPWPSCMVVFMPLATVESRLSALGFEDIQVDTSNSRMDIWDQVKSENKDQVDEFAELEDKSKLTIHRGDPRFDFLKQMDMNEVCARVTIFARKSASN